MCLNRIKRTDYENLARLSNGTDTPIYRHRLHVFQIGTCQFWNSAGKLFCSIFPEYHLADLDYFYRVVGCHYEGNLQEAIKIRV